VAIPAGAHRLGPDNSRLRVKTRRTGAAAKAGHDLLIEVGTWTGVLDVGQETTVALTADAASFRVLEGTGGLQSLGDEERASILQSIDDDVLKRQEIRFASTEVHPGDGGTLGVRGDLTLAGTTHPIGFDLRVADDGTLSGSAIVTQSNWGMKPFSILFGTLKVVDEVEVVLEGTQPL
jgi:polyisoprenoid-binding protein YceI